MRRLFETEPAVLLGFIRTVLLLAAALGLQVSEEQVGAITALAAAVLAVIGSFMTRQAVYSPATVKEIKADAEVIADARVQNILDDLNEQPPVVIPEGGLGERR